MSGEQQGTHFWLITVQKQLPGGVVRHVTLNGTTTPRRRVTRYDMYDWAYQQVIERYPEMQDAWTLAFSFDRNEP